MATANHLVSVEEYLASPAFERYEYEGGVVTEKPMPDWKHSRLCGWIIALILKFYPEYVAGPEVRARLRPDKWRLPDVMVALLEDVKRLEYATEPPHLCIEVLSKDDELEEMKKKCDSYHEWGVPYCWILDPDKRIAWHFARGSQIQQTDQSLTAGVISLSVDIVFSCLNDDFRPTLLNSNR